MVRIAVKSSNIKAIGYDPATETLEVEFLPSYPKNRPSQADPNEPGRLYQYEKVPFDKYKQFLNAPSVGSHFAAHIRNNYQSHRIDTPKEKQDAQDSQEETKED